MGFAILADFPLGTYRGRRPDGALDMVPSPGRLHAALLNAAGQGVRAELVDGILRPSEPDQQAIAWTEANPPDGMRIPRLLRNGVAVITYRNTGLWEGWKQTSRGGKGAGCVAVDGEVGWIWGVEPPVQVAEALDALCRDVSHLGTTESPVVLRVGRADATHQRDPAATAFTGRPSSSQIELDIATPGRAQILEGLFLEARAAGRGAERATKTEAERPSRVDRAGLVTARFIQVDDHEVDASVPPAPWDRVVLIPFEGRLPAGDRRVAWAVALHRALVGLIGDGASSLITGRYEPGARRPANRLAIQFIDGTFPLGFELDGAAAVLLLPTDADGGDLATLANALRRMPDLRIDRNTAVRLRQGRLKVVDGTRFWAPVPMKHRRLWSTYPVAIPELRPPRQIPWSVEDAALLSVGLVWRDLLGLSRGPDRFRRLVETVNRHGGAVIEAHRLHQTGAERYVHRVQAAMVIQPYQAILSLGALAGDRTIIAIGQSRHLGGGLLVPSDTPDAR